MYELHTCRREGSETADDQCADKRPDESERPHGSSLRIQSTFIDRWDIKNKQHRKLHLILITIFLLR